MCEEPYVAKAPARTKFTRPKLRALAFDHATAEAEAAQASAACADERADALARARDRLAPAVFFREEKKSSVFFLQTFVQIFISFSFYNFRRGSLQRESTRVLVASFLAELKSLPQSGWRLVCEVAMERAPTESRAVPFLEKHSFPSHTIETGRYSLWQEGLFVGRRSFRTDSGASRRRLPPHSRAPRFASRRESSQLQYVSSISFIGLCISPKDQS